MNTNKKDERHHYNRILAKNLALKHLWFSNEKSLMILKSFN